MRDADIVVFDDSFSALDVATDARLRAALAGELEDTTVIIVAQRVATIMRADRIIVMDGGRIVGMGTHRRAARIERDLSRDRVLAALRGGGRGMSGRPAAGPTRAEAPPGGRTRRARRSRGRRSGGGPGGRPGGGPRGGMMMGMGMGLPPAKARDFGGSLRRLLGGLRPEAPLVAVVIVLAVVSVTFADPRAAHPR